MFFSFTDAFLNNTWCNTSQANYNNFDLFVCMQAFKKIMVFLNFLLIILLYNPNIVLHFSA